jgi:DNA-binding XRE family transcriptional regulator
MLLMGGGFYFYEVMSQSLRFDEWVSLVIPELIKLTLILIIVSIIGHIMIVTISPNEAEAKLD